MNIDLILTGGTCAPELVRGKTAAVIDVLRATSVIVAALESGASAVVPFAGIDEARRYAEERPGRVLLGGERNAVRIEGFDCGNSPLEYTRERVAGREIALTTTNGTRAIESAKAARTLLILCMRNVPAVAEKILAEGRDCAVVCAGTEGKFSADDALCAGVLLDLICARTDAALDDAGRFARDLWRMGRAGGAGVKELLAECTHLNRLRAHGFEADLDHCLTVGAANVLPVYRDGRITVPPKR